MKIRIPGAVSALAAVLIVSAVHALPARAADIIAEWANVKPPQAPALKPVTVDPKTTALMVMDILPAFYCSDHPRCVAMLPAVKSLLTAAQAAKATVVYTVGSAKFGRADILKEVAPIGDEPTVASKADKFLNTDLEKILKDKGIQTVIVTGTAANGAVLYTGSAAAMRGFKVIVPVDCLASEDLFAEQLTVWQLAHGPGFGPQVTVSKSDMIKF